MFPKFLLKKLYLKSSLKLIDNGFSFVIKNNITTSVVVEVYHLKFNEKEMIFNQIVVQSEDKSASSDLINKNNPFPLIKGKQTTFLINYPPALDYINKKVNIGLKFKIKGISTISFNFTDNLKA